MAAQDWILHVDLDQFLAAVEVLRRPELAGRPVVVGGDGDPGRLRQVVATASYEARAYGVHSGMPLAAAARACPDAVFLPSDKPAYEAASARVMEVLRSFPVVVEVWGWDEAFVGARTDDPEDVARSIKARLLDETGLTCAVGIGETKLQAKTATSFAKPGGVARLTRREWIPTMGDRPVTAVWGIGDRTASRLAALGITTVEQLARADRDELARAFGPTIGPHLVVLGLGGDDAPVDDAPYVARGRGREVTFRHDVVREDLPAHIAALAEEVTAAVVADGRRVTHVAVKLRTRTFFTRTKIAKLPAPTTEPDEVVRMAGVVLDRFDLRGPFRLAGVRVVLELPDPAMIRSVQLGSEGRPVDDVIADLLAMRDGDVRWADGRTFSLVYDGGPSVHEVAERAARAFLHDNALNTSAFPSLGRIQSEVVAWTADLLNAPPGAAGFLTSGGTESIQCAVLAARERGRVERDITAPQMVVAASAHAAFHKSAHLFGVEAITTPVLADWTADVDAMAAAVGPRTVLVVGSAPQYPQGVVDPIPAIAELAASVGANCHVDACMGGFVLPFAERLGRPVPPWDFRVEGVDTISADIHKLGYAPKGASVILHRSKELRRYQTFVFDGWLGGFYASPNLQGTRSGAPMAAAWAVMQHLGVDGYVELTRRTLGDADRLRAAIAGVDGVRVLGDSTLQVVAMAAERADVDVFAIGDALAARGWYVDRQTPPDALHATVSNTNAGVIDEYLSDLAACVAAAGGRRAGDRSTDYATLE